MKNLPRGFYFVSLLGLAIYLTSCVSTKLPDTYQVEPEVLEAKGGNVEFKVTGTIPAKSFHKKAVVEFTPFLKYDGKTKELKKLVLRGEKTEGEGTVINSKTGGGFTYAENFEYTDDMHIAELMVNAKITKGKKVQEINDNKLADGIIITYKNIIHDEKPISAPSGYEAITIVSEKAAVYFRQNKHNLDWGIDLNKSEKSTSAIAKVDEFLAQGWEIKDITIDAWASPEGEIDFNTDLANDRAATVNKYMEEKVSKITKKRAKELGVEVSELEQQVKYQIKGNGEDWDGFMESVRNSDLKDKNTIINVVNAQSDASKREQEIRNMTVIYNEVAETILPPLRRAEIVVNCYEPKRTDEEIAQLAVTDPNTLTYKELLHAATLTDDHQTRYNIYRAGFTHENRDWKTYNNACVEAIELNMIAEAENLIGQAGKLSANNGIIENNMGVIACRNEDYETAEKHFLNAQQSGEDVSYNLGIISIQKGEYQKALVYFKGMNCNHNMALAELLSGNMNESLKNLKCAPESPNTFYMLAVYGARTNNADMVLENLGNAIALDASLKAKAKDDREFLKFASDSNFNQLVN